MASKTDTSTAGRSDLSTVTAAALRLDPLLRKIRDGLSQYLEAFALATQGARRQDIKWPLFTVVVPDPGDGGTIDLVPQEAGDFVGFDNFGICRFNIPISEADIETAASYLRHCGLDPDAQRLLEVFEGLKAAFCSVVEFIPLSDGLMANRKFYAQDRALMLSDHLEDLIRTLPTILTDGGAGQSRKAESDDAKYPPQPAKPRKHLATWRDILIALEMQNNDEDRQKVDRLNETYNGPIIKPGQGKQPFADNVKLLEWWNGLEEMVESQASRDRDTKETVKGTHAYGREGEVVPEISGSVKRRRRDRQP